MTVLLVDPTPLELRIGVLNEAGEVVRLHHEHPGRQEPRLGDVVRAKAHAHDRRLDGVFCDLGEAGQGFLPTKGRVPTLGRTLTLGVRREAMGGKACQLADGPSLRLPGATVRTKDAGPVVASGPLRAGEDDREAVEARAMSLAEAAFGEGEPGVVRAVPALVRAVTTHLSAETGEVRCTDADAAALLRGWLGPLGVTVALYGAGPIRAALDEAEEGALARIAPLPGGGRLVFDEAEALTAVDVDLGRTPGQSGKGAAERAAGAMFAELARQAALRLVGGQVVIDVPRRAVSSPKILRDRLARALSHAGRPSVPAVTGEGVCVVVAPRPVPSLLERLTEPHGEGVRQGRRLRTDVVAARAYRAAEAALAEDRTARLAATCPRRAAPQLSSVLSTLNARYGDRLTVEETEGEEIHVR